MIERLRRLDPDEVTPCEALALLYSLTAEIAGRSGRSGAGGGRMRGCRIPAAGAALLLLGGCVGERAVVQPQVLGGRETVAYPIALWDAGIEGATTLRVWVTEDRLVLLKRREQEPVQVRMAKVLPRRMELSLTGRLSGGAGRNCE